MWVRFVADYIFTPEENRRTAIKYKAGYRGSVRKQCGEKAIAAGRAVLSQPPRRPKAS